jgi:hypothetical protein
MELTADPAALRPPSDAVAFANPTAVRYLAAALAGDVAALGGALIAAAGPETAAAATRAGLPPTVVAAGLPALAAALAVSPRLISGLSVRSCRRPASLRPLVVGLSDESSEGDAGRRARPRCRRGLLLPHHLPGASRQTSFLALGLAAALIEVATEATMAV